MLWCSHAQHAAWHKTHRVCLPMSVKSLRKQTAETGRLSSSHLHVVCISLNPSMLSPSPSWRPNHRWSGKKKAQNNRFKLAIGQCASNQTHLLLKHKKHILFGFLCLLREDIVLGIGKAGQRSGLITICLNTQGVRDPYMCVSRLVRSTILQVLQEKIFTEWHKH